ncbi:D-alanine--D-alanine ligase family protein [Kyrpidia spormannii]|uniref:D-alanine--D-alanine ligase n=2 Tax=Kyrpidia spormannii TaxID=2055160 RepID=A0ACA8ZB41_9BACL|nr:D-alanine--D-alanine ligase family protein [Kyrpidia spormannii]CAB3393347.1 D-alanine--D-alanine ligase [Kyrpidia spormannii]CAB3394262.1 D-alanine--D-alanine ligase [Kyrpidia spormannii]
MKKLIAVIFGGRSVEHEVSIVTAQQIIYQLRRDLYDVMPLYIDKEGAWWTGDVLAKLESFKAANRNAALAQAARVIVVPTPGGGVIEDPRALRGLFRKPRRWTPDVAILATHGTYGEDGCLQGLLEMAGIPYTGPGVLGSAVGMDKILMKDVFRAQGIPVVDYMWVHRDEWHEHPDEVADRVEGELQYPVFVKPSNLGSSVGIGRAEDRDGLFHALDVAAGYDRRLLIEQGVVSPREINCSVLADGKDLRVSLCEEPVSWEAFLSYEDKYIRGNFTKGQTGRRIPAELPDGVTETVQELARRAFRAIQARGVARVDFLLSPDGSIYVNEINTIPGSLSFYLWEPSGVSFPDLLDKLIEDALGDYRDKSRNIFTYDTDLIEQFGRGGKVGSKSSPQTS